VAVNRRIAFLKFSVPFAGKEFSMIALQL